MVELNIWEPDCTTFVFAPLLEVQIFAPSTARLRRFLCFLLLSTSTSPSPTIRCHFILVVLALLGNMCEYHYCARASLALELATSSSNAQEQHPLSYWRVFGLSRVFGFFFVSTHLILGHHTYGILHPTMHDSQSKRWTTSL